MGQQPLPETYHAILENIGEGIIFINGDDVITYINQTAETMRGISARNYIGRSVESIHSPASAERIETLLQGLRDGSIERSRQLLRKHLLSCLALGQYLLGNAVGLSRHYRETQVAG